jgi:hypothetical protein
MRANVVLIVSTQSDAVKTHLHEVDRILLVRFHPAESYEGICPGTVLNSVGN